MKLQERVDRIGAIASALGRWIVGDIRGHWVLALFSVAVAFGIWLIIEDVSDPREETRAPANSGIPVQAVNVPDEFLEPTLGTVIVRVRGRESDIRDLRPEDFRATVDLADYEPESGGMTVAVRVTARRNGVEVLEVIPAAMPVQLEPAASKLVEVTARVIALPPAGFRVKQVDGKDVPPSITPSFVTVTGPEDLVERLARVELDVDLSNARIERYPSKGDLVARSAEGNVLQVRLTHTRAEATFEIESVFAPRTLGLAPQITGEVAHGYYVVSVTVEPPTVEVTGPQVVIENLSGPLVLEPLDVSGQTATFVRSRRVEPPGNVEVEVETAVVTVEIAPIEATVPIYPAVELTDLGNGLAVLPGSVLTTRVVVRGNLLAVEAVVADPSQLQATVSLSGVQAGTATLQPEVRPPPGIEVVSVSTVTVLLTAGPG